MYRSYAYMQLIHVDTFMYALSNVSSPSHMIILQATSSTW